MNSELIAVKWYSSIDTCGFVLILDEFMGYKCYLGPWPVRAVDPRALDIDEASAANYIRCNGAKVEFLVAMAVFRDVFATGLPIRYDGQDTGMIMPAGI